MAEDLLHYLDERHIQRASIIGHSMGGKTALVFAHRHPDRVHKLVVADMAARAYAPHHGSIFDALLSAPIDSAESRSVVETHLTTGWMMQGWWPFLMKNLRREKSGGFTWRPNIAVLAPAIGAVVDEVPLSMNTLPILAITVASRTMSMQVTSTNSNRRACSFSPMKSRARAIGFTPAIRKNSSKR